MSSISWKSTKKIVNALILTKDTKGRYKLFIDQIVKVYFPHQSETPELHNLVKTYQKHSSTCRKYKNVACTFGFGRFLLIKQLLLTLPAEMSDIES